MRLRIKNLFDLPNVLNEGLLHLHLNMMEVSCSEIQMVLTVKSTW